VVSLHAGLEQQRNEVKSDKSKYEKSEIVLYYLPDSIPQMKVYYEKDANGNEYIAKQERFFNNGQLIRKWIQVEGEVAVNIGDELPEEPKDYFNEEFTEEERDEWSILALAEKITGISEDIMFDGKYNIYQ